MLLIMKNEKGFEKNPFEIKRKIPQQVMRFRPRKWPEIQHSLST